jgi:CheY-like chemotaxis protein
MAKVLIIDDSAFQRRTLRKILNVDGHDIKEATNGREGLEVFAQFEPDCIVLDILMPDLNGLGFLQELRKQGATTPVLVLTADIQDTTSQECLKLGAKDVVHKPLLPSEGDRLRNIINDILESGEGAIS